MEGSSTPALGNAVRRMLRSPLLLVLAFTALVLTSCLFVDRLRGAQMHEPLTWDEISTVETYSWATFRADGLPTHVPRADDLLVKHRPNAMQLIAGLYRAVGVWREPNDHVVNSVLVNLTTAALPGSELAIRLPAWLGAVFFAGLLGWFAFRTGHHTTWPFALVLGAGLPYVNYYSVQARGYSWMLALELLLVWLLTDVLPKRARSVLWGALIGLVAILTFANMLSLVVDWLVPLYVALWLVPPRPNLGDWSSPEVLSAGDTRAFRTNLLVQGLVTSFLFVIFVVAHLPYVLVSVQEFGIPAKGLQFFARLFEVLAYLLPHPVWALVALAGVAGWVVAWRRPGTRYLGAVGLLTCGVSLFHFVATRKLPYARTCGYFLPLFVLGATHLLETSVRAVAERWRALIAAGSGLLASVFVLSVHLHERSVVSYLVPHKEGLRRTLTHDRPFITTRDPVEGWVRLRHVPSWFLTSYDSLSDVQAATHLAFLVNPADPQSRTWVGGPGWQHLRLPDRELEVSPAAVRPVDAARAPAAYPALVLWIPAADREEIRNELLRAAFDGLDISRETRHRTIFQKWEFANQIYGIELRIDTPSDFEHVVEALRRGKDTLRGRAVMIEPTSG